MKTEPNVVVCARYFRPGFKAGGPVQSLAAVYDSVPSVGFHVVTGDRDLGDAAPYSGLDLQGHLDDPAVTYLDSRGLRGHLRVVRELRRLRIDVVYLNGLWASDFTIAPLAAMVLGVLPRRPVLVAPRGELGHSAIRISRWKKKLVGVVLRRVILSRLDITWQATSAHEAEDIRVWAGSDSSIVQVPNLTTGGIRTSVQWSPRPAYAPLRVVMVARAARVKNIETAIRAMSFAPDATLEIYGPLEDREYVRECVKLAEGLGVSVAFHGPVPSARVPDLLMRHDVLLFPTHGENFGHAIAEALKAGTPVLTSDATPWTAVLAAADMPVCCATDHAAFGEHLRSLALATPEQLSSKRDRTRMAFERWREANDDAPLRLSKVLSRLSSRSAVSAGARLRG